MSFIFDALKRAERERKVGRSPDLTTVCSDETRLRRRVWPWFLLGGALLLNAAVLAAVNWSKLKGADTALAPIQVPKPATSSPAAKPQAATAAGASAPESSDRPTVEAAETVPVTGTENGLPQPERTRVAEPPAASIVEAPRVDPVAAESSAPAGVSAKDVGAKAPTPADTAAPVAARSAQKTLRGLTVVPAERLGPERPKSLAKSESSPESASAPAPKAETGEPVPVAQLPEEVRRLLPGMEVNVHVFSEDPDQRFVFINMQRYRVGDRVGEGGPQVEEITLQGVVLDYGAGRALLGLPNASSAMKRP